MSPLAQAKRRWGGDRALHALEHCRVAMTPHWATLETDVGKRSLCLVSAFAMLVHAGIESPAALADAIKLAETMSGIPAATLDTYAQYTFAFLEGAAMEKQGPVPAGRAGNEGAAT